MTQHAQSRLRLASLRKDAPTEFSYSPGPADAEAIKARLELLGLRKMRLTGEVAPVDRSDWHLTARLGATVVQPCSVTLEPVTTRIEEDISRLYTRAYTAPKDGEAEMPEDDTQEPLPDAIDLAALAEEALALALPAFPRAGDAEPFEAQATPPGAAPLDDADARPSPFAALADLKRKLED